MVISLRRIQSERPIVSFESFRNFSFLWQISFKLFKLQEVLGTGASFGIPLRSASEERHLYIFLYILTKSNIRETLIIETEIHYETQIKRHMKNNIYSYLSHEENFMYLFYQA